MKRPLEDQSAIVSGALGDVRPEADAQPVLELSIDAWQRELSINLTGAFAMAQAAAKRLVADNRPGRIVFIGSWAGHRPHIKIPAYCVAKAGLRMLMKQLALELAPAEQYTGNINVADRHGRRLGHAVLSQLQAMGPPGTRLAYVGPLESGAVLGIWRPEPSPGVDTLAAVRTEVQLPLKDLPSVGELTAQLAACSDPPLAERLRRKLRLVSTVGEGPTFTAPLWMWRVGDGLLIGQANEAYSLLQRTLRERLAPRPVAVMNLVNGSGSYLVPADRCNPGLYAFWSSVFDAGAFERVRDQALSQAQAMLNA